MKVRVYKWVVLISFLILILVQLELTYNTYVLRDREYRLKEKQLIKDAYGKSIADDKVYQGGGKILDSILSEKMPLLKRTYLENPKKFKGTAQLVSSAIFTELKKRSTMDSVFQSIIKRNQLDPSLKYLLTFESIEVNFNNRTDNIYVYKGSSGKQVQNTNAGNYGFIIDGTLASPSELNMVTSLAVNGTLLYDYRVTFDLFVDSPNRPLKVFYNMLPTFLLVGLCIIIMFAINYYTFKNWMRQKKEAEVKSDFLNSIKHELNTPIATILIASKSLDEEDVITDKNRVRNLAQIVERQARRLHAHINQMLEISEIRKHISLQETDLNYAILTFVSDYRIKLQSSDDLIFDLHESENLVMLDNFAFTAMVQNIVDNAFKHNVSVNKKVKISISEGPNSFFLHINDNGNGMNKKLEKKIFDKFFRAQTDTSVPGLGLGLYYVKQCIDLHGWSIKLETEVGKGTEFIIRIPRISFQNRLEKGTKND
ncbi:sensor histidine kinase KdpD [Pedobacter sp. Leaf194]|uniref:sensor histidine kinase n=1 Tax=Pedobacter sp. Leaf194 TaxID=1736297 RepID=UPI0007039677|nr:HAMP domain-containing sensor histidine kinase [Pedobacter sp. Leaf194]KQS36312.1 hypothetical protein ASG14_12900 [Pedobacter sp. Leaf194]